MERLLSYLVYHVPNELGLCAINTERGILCSLLALLRCQIIHILSVLLMLLTNTTAIEQFGEQFSGWFDIQANRIKAWTYHKYRLFWKFNTPFHNLYLSIQTRHADL